MNPADKPVLHLLTLEDLARPTGQQARLVNLIPELARHFEIGLVGRPGALPANLAELIGPRIELPLPESTRALQYFMHPAGPLRLRRLARALAAIPVKGGILYCESLLLAALAAPSSPRLLAAEVNGIACEEVARKLKVGGGLAHDWLRERERRGLMAAHCAIAVSDGIAGYLRRLAPETGARVEVIGNGINPRLFHTGVSGCKIRRDLELGNDPVAVMHSTFRPWHGIENLLDAWSIVVGDLPRARLLLVGDGPGRGAAQDRAETLGLADSVFFPGAIDADEIPQWIAAADVGVYFPDFHVEGHGFLGHPIKLLEYMAVGRPVVTIDDTALAATVTAAGAGVLARPGARPFAGAIMELFADAPRRVELGRNGAKYIAANHTWAKIADRIAEFLSR